MTTRKKATLSKRQVKEIEDYLHLFSDVEAAIKKRLGRNANDRSAVSTLINDYVEKNPYWIDRGNQLRNLASIRNLLTHQRSTTDGYPIAVAPPSLDALRTIRHQLSHPESVSTRHRKQVLTVSSQESLAAVLTKAFENGFSQFPVINDGEFRGLITENEITRWLGRHVKHRSPQVDLENVTVRVVLKEKDPDLKGLQIFRFEGLDAPVDEVMAKFSLQQALEVVLLTSSGRKDSPIEGIVTQWDAARHVG